MSIGQLLNIGRSALQAAQMGLQVSGNNIANVNTPNYSRQVVSLVEGVVVSMGGVPVGTGVQVEGIQRIYDSFLGVQIRSANAGVEDYGLREQSYARIESILYPSETSNLGALMDDFFNAWQDLAGNPSGSAERQVTLSRAEDLIANLRSLSGSFDEEIRYTNTLLEGYAEEINRLASEVADLNGEILRNQGGRSPPNDLLDRRESLLSELSGYVDVTVVEQDRGVVSVLVSGGQPLVDGTTSYGLELVPDLDNHNFYRMLIRGNDVTESIQGGKVKGVLETRVQMVRFQDDIDLMAAALVQEFNAVHRSGVGLDGNTGRDFFSPLQVTASPLSGNQGGAEVSLHEVVDSSGLTLDDYEIRFTGPGTYDVLNTTQGTVVAGDQAYVSGSNIEFDGLRVALSDSSGPPLQGDRFRISVKEGMAQTIALQIEDPAEIAAAQDPNALPGDNRNALALADLRNAKILREDSVTFGGFYESLVMGIGSLVQDASRMGESKQVLYESMESYRESVSGVSLEEEEIRLLSFQHAYQSAAKYLAVLDEVFQELFDL
jgi:flagellar hook-associated protein 1 FlgK